MDAILLAGGVPTPESALYPYTLGKPKAAIKIGDKTMIQWVLDALNQSDTIEGIFVVGCEDMQEELISHKIIGFKPDAGDIILNFQQGADGILEHNPNAKSVAVVSSDIPMLTAESVNWVINSSLKSEKDIYYCVIDQIQMEKRFPESARSYVKLRDMNVCGGDLSIMSLDLYADRKDFWRKIFQARKSYLHQASLIGFDILLLLLLRRLTFDDVVKKVTRRLDITGQGLICPYPELGMDVDKPHQLEFARRELS
ncbi:MAG: NTP transferase domain-containing protein [Chloroflexi bacterium]|nr:NTP transferase domain-containing protein [Chloroflexota bacterium]